MKVLHVITETAVDPKHFFLGSTKDIDGRTFYFSSRGIECEQIVPEARNDKALLARLAQSDMSRYEAVIFEFPRYPRTMRYLKQRYPALKLIIRSHNAEFYHCLHYFYVCLRFMMFPQALRYLVRAARLLKNDFLCGRYADHILTICAWEKEFYWRFIAGYRKLINVPYFLTEKYLLGIDSKRKTKENTCVCLMSTAINPFLLDALRNFCALVRSLGSGETGWKFLVTGNLDSNRFVRLPQRITVTGFLANPMDVQKKSRAVAVLSDYGFGFKTKILDAVLNQCYVLVTRGLYDRLPVQIRKYCYVVRSFDRESSLRALEFCLQPFPEGDPNAAFRQEAVQALDTIFYKDVAYEK